MTRKSLPPMSLLLLVLAASPLRAQEASSSRFREALSVSYLGLQVADAAMTVKALGAISPSLEAREGNAFMASLTAHPVALVGTKLALGLSTVYLTRRLAVKHPTMATVALLAANVAYVGIVANNVSAVRRIEAAR